MNRDGEGGREGGKEQQCMDPTGPKGKKKKVFLPAAPLQGEEKKGDLGTVDLRSIAQDFYGH